MILLASTGAFCSFLLESSRNLLRLLRKRKRRRNFHAYLDAGLGSGGPPRHPPPSNIPDLPPESASALTIANGRMIRRRVSKARKPTSSREPGRPKENRSLRVAIVRATQLRPLSRIFCKLPKKVYSTAMIPCRSARSCPEASGFRSARWVAFHKRCRNSREHANQTVSDYEDILARLEALPKHFRPKYSASPGWAEARLLASQIILRDGSQTQSLTSLPADPSKSALLAPFSDFPNSHSAIRTHTPQASAPKRFTPRAVLPAVTRYHDYVANTYIPVCQRM